MRSDFWGLPYAAQTAIRRGERQATHARSLSHRLRLALSERDADRKRIEVLKEALCGMLAAYRELRALYGPAEKDAFEQRDNYLRALSVMGSDDDD